MHGTTVKKYSFVRLTILLLQKKVKHTQSLLKKKLPEYILVPMESDTT